MKISFIDGSSLVILSNRKDTLKYILAPLRAELVKEVEHRKRYLEDVASIDEANYVGGIVDSLKMLDAFCEEG